MIGLGWARKHVNQNVNIIRQVVKRAVENELVPGGVLHALQAVSPLKAGRSAARATEPVKPVGPVMTYVWRQVSAVARLQRLAGRRPGEVVIMRGVGADT